MNDTTDIRLSDADKAILERIRNPIVYRRVAILETLCGSKQKIDIEPTRNDIHLRLRRRLSSADFSAEPTPIAEMGKIRTFRFQERRRYPRQGVEVWHYLEAE